MKMLEVTRPATNRPLESKTTVNSTEIDFKSPLPQCDLLKAHSFGLKNTAATQVEKPQFPQVSFTEVLEDSRTANRHELLQNFKSLSKNLGLATGIATMAAIPLVAVLTEAIPAWRLKMLGVDPYVPFGLAITSLVGAGSTLFLLLNSALNLKDLVKGTFFKPNKVNPDFADFLKDLNTQFVQKGDIEGYVDMVNESAKNGFYLPAPHRVVIAGEFVRNLQWGTDPAENIKTSGLLLSTLEGAGPNSNLVRKLSEFYLMEIGRSLEPLKFNSSKLDMSSLVGSLRVVKHLAHPLKDEFTHLFTRISKGLAPQPAIELLRNLRRARSDAPEVQETIMQIIIGKINDLKDPAERMNTLHSLNGEKKLTAGNRLELKMSLDEISQN